MGSLTAGWDSTRPGKAPHGFEDFKEPVSPRAKPTPSPFGGCEGSGDVAQPAPGGPPNLIRRSPPPIHGASAVQRYLQRASSGSPGAVPPSPRVSTPRTPHKLCLKVGDEEMAGQPLSAKEKWCVRVESSRLNERPDEPEDADSWRHGSFKMDDAAHAMHLPGSPRAAAAAQAAAQASFAAAAAAAVAEVPEVAARPCVTVASVPEEAMQSLDSSGL